MERAFVSLGSGLAYLQDKLNVSANNLANASTYGFKKDYVIGRSFNGILSDALAKHYEPPEKRWNSGRLLFKPGVYTMDTVTDYGQGRLVETENLLDLALDGDGFLVYENQDGAFYGRGATLDVDREGYLMAPGKGRVLGLEGAIQIGQNEFTIDRQGNVIVNGATVGQLQIVELDNREGLLKVENQPALWRGGAANPAANPQTRLLQGHLEASNTDVGQEMIAVTDALRKYEAIHRLLQMVDQIAGVAANELGKV